MQKKILEYTAKYAVIKTFCDCTIGEGGHTEFLRTHLEDWKFIGIDKDDYIIKIAQKRVGSDVVIYNDSYINIRNHYRENIGVFLLDLGLSMYHIRSENRGFSFNRSEDKLDMRFSQNTKIDAAFILNNYSYNDLIRIFTDYGDIKKSDTLAERIINWRKKNIFVSVRDLLSCLNFKRNYEKKHPLTLVFQALRIEVNNELSDVAEFLQHIETIGNRNSLFIFIAYHSGEDRLIKTRIKELLRENKIELFTKHVLKPQWDEVKKNKAARSARMRIFKLL
jgi:16S rRNA (cytosine1402-N4)-methyltransferase